MNANQVFMAGIVASSVTGPIDDVPVWSVASLWTPTVKNNNWSGYTSRAIIPAVALSNKTGTKLRFTFSADATTGLQVAKCYAQMAPVSGGDAYDYRSTPVQALFGGNASFSINAGQTIVSDDINLVYDGSAPLVVGCYYSDSTRDDLAAASVANWATRYRSGDQAAVVDVASTGWALAAYSATALTKIEIFG